MKILKIRDVKTPIRANDDDAGVDFFIPDDYNGKLDIEPQESILIPSGIKARVPSGYALIAFNKSGIATKKNLQVGACVVDCGYTGEIHIHLTNVSNKNVTINPGDKIVQFLLVPLSFQDIETVDSEDELYSGYATNRGDGGFGSTGSK